MSTPAPVQRDRPAETVAGLMAAAAVLVGPIALAYKPVRIAPAAVLLALVAAGIGGRHQRLAGFAVAVAAISWVLGMTIAVLTENPLY